MHGTHLRQVFGRALGAVALVAALAAAASGCGDSPAHSAEPAAAGPINRGGTLYVDNAQEPPTLNPWLAAGGMAIVRTITDPMREPLVRLDDAGQWQPALAKRVPDVAHGDVVRTPYGGMIVRVLLRAGLTWSDGKPITCDDIRFTWQTVMDDRWQVGTRIGWDQLSDVRCPAPRLAVLEFAHPYAPYLQDILAAAPLPAHALRHADFNTAWTSTVSPSSGPFLVDHWTRGDELVLRRNPGWWGAGRDHKPYLDRIVWRFVPDAQTMKLDLRMQETQLIGLPPDSNLDAELSAIHTAHHAVRPGAAWEQLSFNTQSPVVGDARVRQAIAYAVDRTALTDVVLQHQASVLDSTLLPSQGPGYEPDFARYRHDPARVAQLMGTAGWSREGKGPWTKHGRVAHLTLETTAGNPLRMKAIQLLQQQLEQAGFEVALGVGKPEVFFGNVVAPGRFDIAMFSFGSGPDPDQSKLFACSEIPRAPGWRGKNDFRYCDPEVDRLLRAADVELDRTRRAELLHRVQRILAEDVPTLPLFQPPDTLAWDARLHGVRPNPVGRHLWNVEDWWLAP